MSVLTINAAESSYFNRGEKKAAWRMVRQRLGISKDVALGVSNVSSAPDFGKLYRKGTAPRQYLISPSGRTTTDLNYLAAPAAEGAGAIVAGRYAVAAAPAPARRPCKAIRRADLLSLLRNYYRGTSDVTAPPADFPKDLPDDAVVLDPSVGVLYFRA